MRGKGCIYQRKGRRGWTARIRVAGHYRYAAFDTKANAEAWVQRELGEVAEAEARGLPVLRQKVRFEMFANRWLKSVRARVTPKTYAGYQSVVKSVLIREFGEKPLHDISTPDIEEFIAKRNERGARREKSGVSPATVNRNLTVLSQIFKHALSLRATRFNPVVGVKRPREEMPASFYFDAEDEKRLLAALPGWLHAPALLALDGGLRAGEIEALTRRDVDLRRRVVAVRRSKNKQPREVGLTNRLSAALATHLKAVPREAVVLFEHSDGRAFSANVYRSDWERAAKAAKIVGFRFHDLRHACGVRLAEHGAPPAVIKAFLGHKTLEATLRYIRHAPADAARTAAALLDAQPSHAAAGAADVGSHAVSSGRL